MRKIVLIVVVAVVCLVVAWSFTSDYQPKSAAESSDAQPDEPLPEKIAAVREALKKEPKIKDFVFDPEAAVQWQIGVLDDGSSRVGYANYICELLAEHGASDARTQVRIVDIAKVSRGENFRSASLGHVACSDRRVITP